MLPPANTSLHMAARALMMSKWSQRDSACVQTRPPGRTARCMASKKGWGGEVEQEEQQWMQ